MQRTWLDQQLLPHNCICSRSHSNKGDYIKVGGATRLIRCDIFKGRRSELSRLLEQDLRMIMEQRAELFFMGHNISAKLCRGDFYCKGKNLERASNWEELQYK